MHTLNRNKIIFYTPVVLLVFLFIPFLRIQAQENINGGSLCLASQNGFSFNLNTVDDSLFAGQSQHVSGVITNNTDYDLQNGDVIVHVVKLSSDDSRNDYGLENDWVQRLVVADGVSIKSKAFTNFDFTWNVPEKIVSGVYALDFYLVSNKAFIKAGSENHSFPAKRMIVSVGGGNGDVAYIKNNSLSMNGELLDSSRVFYFATGSSTPLHVGVGNTGSVSRDVVMKYSLYNSTIIDDSHKVFEGQKMINIHSSSTSNTYLENLSLKKYAYYTVLIELKDGDKSSFITFGLNNTDKPFAKIASVYAKRVDDTHIDVIGCLLLDDQAKKGALNVYALEFDKTILSSTTASVFNWKDITNFSVPISISSDQGETFISLDMVDASGLIMSSVVVPVECDDQCYGSKNLQPDRVIVIVSIVIFVLLIIGFIFRRKNTILMVSVIMLFLPYLAHSQSGGGGTSSYTTTGQAYSTNNSSGTGGVVAFSTAGGGFISVSWAIPDSDRGEPRGDTLPPTLEFTTQPTTIVSGQTATLYWQSYETSTCSAAGAWSGSKPISGNESTGALNSDTTYTLSCAGWDGSSVEKSITVTVTPVEQDVCPNISGSQTTIPAGYTVDGSGQCVLIPPTDVCPNIAGDQATVPAG